MAEARPKTCVGDFLIQEGWENDSHGHKIDGRAMYCYWRDLAATREKVGDTLVDRFVNENGAIIKCWRAGLPEPTEDKQAVMDLNIQGNG